MEKAKPVNEKIPGAFEVPLSNESKRIVAYATEEADLLSGERIGTEHLLLGILREESCLATHILSNGGMRLTEVREELRRNPHDDSAIGSFVRESSSSPADVLELQARIKSIRSRMEEAIANRDFVKASECSDEEGKERDKLYLSCRKYGLTDWIFG